jgi:hypothetical protein
LEFRFVVKGSSRAMTNGGICFLKVGRYVNLHLGQFKIGSKIGSEQMRLDKHRVSVFAACERSVHIDGITVTCW